MEKKSLLTMLALLFVMFYSQAQTAAINNQPAVVPTYRPLPANMNVYGVFEGRPPCREIARQLNLHVSEDCDKMKWRLFLFYDKSGKPDSYLFDGGFFSEQNRQGKWMLSRGTAADPEATVIVLDPDKPQQSLYLMKADENVLFILDEKKVLRVGNENFSYTLNRVKLVAHHPVK